MSKHACCRYQAESLPLEKVNNSHGALSRVPSSGGYGRKLFLQTLKLASSPTLVARPMCMVISQLYFLYRAVAWNLGNSKCKTGLIFYATNRRKHIPLPFPPPTPSSYRALASQIKFIEPCVSHWVATFFLIASLM